MELEAKWKLCVDLSLPPPRRSEAGDRPSHPPPHAPGGPGTLGSRGARQPGAGGGGGGRRARPGPAGTVASWRPLAPGRLPPAGVPPVRLEEPLLNGSHGTLPPSAAPIGTIGTPAARAAAPAPFFSTPPPEARRIATALRRAPLPVSGAGTPGTASVAVPGLPRAPDSRHAAPVFVSGVTPLSAPGSPRRGVVSAASSSGAGQSWNVGQRCPTAGKISREKMFQCLLLLIHASFILLLQGSKLVTYMNRQQPGFQPSSSPLPPAQNQQQRHHYQQQQLQQSLGDPSKGIPPQASQAAAFVMDHHAGNGPINSQGLQANSAAAAATTVAANHQHQQHLNGQQRSGIGISSGLKNLSLSSVQEFVPSSAATAATATAPSSSSAGGPAYRFSPRNGGPLRQPFVAPSSSPVPPAAAAAGGGGGAGGGHSPTPSSAASDLASNSGAAAALQQSASANDISSFSDGGTTYFYSADDVVRLSREQKEEEEEGRLAMGWCQQKEGRYRKQLLQLGCRRTVTYIGFLISPR